MNVISSFAYRRQYQRPYVLDRSSAFAKCQLNVATAWIVESIGSDGFVPAINGQHTFNARHFCSNLNTAHAAVKANQHHVVAHRRPSLFRCSALCAR